MKRPGFNTRRLFIVVRTNCSKRPQLLHPGIVYICPHFPEVHTVRADVETWRGVRMNAWQITCTLFMNGKDNKNAKKLEQVHWHQPLIGIRFGTALENKSTPHIIVTNQIEILPVLWHKLGSAVWYDQNHISSYGLFHIRTTVHLTI